MSSIDIPPAWLLVSAVVALVLAIFAPIVSLPLPNTLGWLIFVVGLLWGISAIAMFLWTKTPIEPRQKPTVLLATGHFRINRNPIYTGMTVMLLGWAVVLGTVSAFLPVLTFPLLITRRFIIGEEQGLREAFGAQAEEYFSRTRRW